MKKYIKKILKKSGFKIERKVNKFSLFILKHPEFKSFKNIDVLVDSDLYLDALKLKFDNFSLLVHKDGFIASLNDIKVYIETSEEFFILKEVFVDEDYMFLTKNKTILIDIGANIGISSLYFSKLKNVEKIYAFEPILDTFLQAKFNFDLNKQISKVTNISNCGLGRKEREEIFLYDKKKKGNVGVRGTKSSSYINNPYAIEQKVKINNVSKEIKQILDENPNSRIVVKMDCEGAEYEIFEDLSSSGLLKIIDIFMIEWHDNGPDLIHEILLENSYNIFPKELTLVSGMIYAVKS